MALSIREKVYGAIFGYAIGDALGIGTEFMSKKEVARYYPDGLKDYSQIIRDAHRSQWQRGECSTDTKIVAEQLYSLIDKKGIDYDDVAHRYRALYESDKVDLTPNLRWVLSQPDYTDHPFTTTKRVWDNMIKFEASNECLGRALFVGLWGEDISESAITFCRLTHAHPRCEAASAVIAEMAYSLMWKDCEASYDSLISLARRLNTDLVRYIEAAKNGSLEDFDLDDASSHWFVRKATGCALWALWHCSSPSEALYAIINQGGDADTNAALAQGLLGIKYGFNALDKTLVDGLVNKEKIDSVAHDLTHLLEERMK